MSPVDSHEPLGAAVDCLALQRKAASLRARIYETVVASKRGHIGGALSCADILVALYYGGILRFNAQDPAWADRDRFILSKGHAGVALYAILADLGFYSMGELHGFAQNGSLLGGHPDRRIPGVEADTGSLGHGLGVGTGMALSAKMDGHGILTFVLLGDGECYEGSVWEACLFASHHELDNLVAIIDRNCQCVLDFTEECVRLDSLKEKFAAFGWDTVEVDGHDLAQLVGVLSLARERKGRRPLAVVAQTIKGKGVSFMEGTIKWHHGIPNPREDRIARRELGLTSRGDAQNDEP